VTLAAAAIVLSSLHVSLVVPDQRLAQVIAETAHREFMKSGLEVKFSPDIESPSVVVCITAISILNDPGTGGVAKVSSRFVLFMSIRTYISLGGLEAPVDTSVVTMSGYVGSMDATVSAALAAKLSAIARAINAVRGVPVS